MCKYSLFLGPPGRLVVLLNVVTLFKAAQSVTFDLLILKIMFLFFKNTVKILKFS